MVILTFSILWLIGECDNGDFDFFDIVTDWGEWCIKDGITREIISSINEMLFVVWDLMRLWMKWMIRKRLESDWMDERDKEPKAGRNPPPCVYLPFLKGTSVDERERMRIYSIE